jgi:hypothetical protein
MVKLYKLSLKIFMILMSLSFGYLISEITFTRLLLPLLSLQKQALLPKGIRPLAQSSKNSLEPENYIAIVGDSYAKGVGDWLNDVLDSNSNPPFNSGNVIHEITGRDVISFGESGAGSIYGLGTAPLQYMQYINNSLLLSLKDPDYIVVYFYEGNDFVNNLNRLDPFKTDSGNIDFTLLYSNDTFDNYLRTEAIYQNSLFAEVNPKWSEWKLKYLTRNLFLFQTLCGGLKCITNPGVEQKKIIPLSSQYVNSTNQVLVAKKAEKIPDGLQGPAMELSEKEIEAAAFVYERSLFFLRENFPDTRIFVAYLPSPITSYNIVSNQVLLKSYLKRTTIFSREDVLKRSDRLVALIREKTKKIGLEFLDTRQVLREASGNAFIHGPRDWKHFNKQGYTVLGREVSKKINQIDKTGSIQ